MFEGSAFNNKAYPEAAATPLEIAVALYAFPNVGAHVCEVMESDSTLVFKDVKVPWLKDEILAAGKATLDNWEESRVDVRKLVA